MVITRENLVKRIKELAAERFYGVITLTYIGGKITAAEEKKSYKVIEGKQ